MPVFRQLGEQPITTRRKLVDASDRVLVRETSVSSRNSESSTFVETIAVPPKLRLWTDDYNNLFQILRPVSSDKDERNK